MFTQNDLNQISQRGTTAEAVEDQIKRFATGFPVLEIVSTAKIGSGITRLTKQEEEAALSRWQEYLDNDGEVLKFVPASGAASRMFKALFEFASSDSDTYEQLSPAHIFIHHLKAFPFYDSLNETCLNLYNKDIDTLLSENKNRDIVKALLNENGMNYGNLPKGLLLFHSYNDGARTPLEEQIVEGIQTAKNSNNIVKLHFTVSENHKKLFEDKVAQVVPDLEKKYQVKIDISLSVQKKSTDTIAVTPDNEPFRNDDGSLLFRPGGHGALIENLNDINSAVIFIKNIDNIVPDDKRESTIRYKQVLAGYLMQIFDKIETYISILDAGIPDDDELNDIIDFVKKTLNISHAVLDSDDDAKKIEFIKEKLNRPLRVCGMVKNEGEPGGGPYITVNSDNSASPQILESTQIAPKFENLMKEATHFNPVDLVCYTKDINGLKFNLPEYVDSATGFISQKSQHGRELKALELPGLWNGAMSNWTTLFIEVPISTFNPVKTVNDLLRPVHQPKQ